MGSLTAGRNAQLEGCAGRPTHEIDQLRNLKARIAKKSSNASQIYDDKFGYGHAKPQVSRSSSVPGLGGKADVEGSHPRKWKPCRNPRAPPGGAETYHPAKDGQRDSVYGKKRFPDMG